MYAYLECGGDNSLAFRKLCNRFNLGDDTDYQKYEEDMYRIAKDIHVWENNLRREDIEYLHKRKITDDTIKEFHIGYNQADNRLVIPIFKNGKPIYWCARSYDSDKSKYKKAYLGESNYLENVLYGYDTLSLNNDTLYVVEGVFDYLSMHQEGYSVLCNATGLSHKNAKQIAELSLGFNKLVLCFDNDVAGKRFSYRLHKLLFEKNINFHVCFIPNDINGLKIKDISDWYSAGFSLDKLFSENNHDGTELFLKSEFGDYDSLYNYCDDHAPYISQRNRGEILKFARTLPECDEHLLKELKNVLKRAKRHGEYADEFISKYPYRIQYKKSLGFYRFVKNHWERIDEYELKKSFIEMGYDLPMGTERSVFDKLKSKTNTTKTPNERLCLNLNNGTLYFDEMIGKYYHFVPSHDPDDFCDYILDYDYNTSITENADVDEFLNTVTSYDSKLINRFMEYFGSVFIDRSIDTKAYLFYGNGANGKSVLTYMLECMLGKNKLCSYIGLNTLSRQFELVNLIGKRVNFCHESSADTKESEEILKSLMSNTVTNANVKNHDAVQFTPKCKFFFDTNSLPKPKDQTDGWNRRFRGTTHMFRNTFTNDQAKIDNISVFQARTNIELFVTTSNALSYILNLSLEGYKRIIDNGYHFSDKIIDAEAELDRTRAGDPLQTFAEDFDWEYDSYSTDELFDHYLHMCEIKNISKFYRKDYDYFKINIKKTFSNVYGDDGFKQIRVSRSGGKRGYRRISK